MFTVIAFILVLAMLVMVYFKAGGFESQLVGVKMRAAQALYCADSGIEYGKWKLKNSDNWSSASYPSQPVNTNLGTFSVKFNLVTSTETSKIGSLISDGTYMGITRRVTADVFIEIPDQNILFSSNGALIGPSKLDGGMTIDGRDHQSSSPYNVNPNNGTWAVVTKVDSNSIQPDGALTIGGTNITSTPYVDHPSSNIIYNNLPKYKQLDQATLQKIVKFNATNLPASPDAIFDKPPGTVKQLAIENGAFYSGTTPSNNLKSGINYIQLPLNGYWDAGQIVPPTDGKPIILIIHNDSVTASVKNLGGNRSTVLTGLVATDNINVSPKCTIVGNMYVLNTTTTAGNGNLIFCRTILQQILNYLADVKLTNWHEKIPI